ncbi:MAG TPA: hypothetical protein IGS53_06325 [Leptolyngbyaceae cyanobacterium M33_DOE_097]|nr:hypothetical protein [Leptolyngbyaceae cyanobacterium M33_DOE_097]
MVNQSVPGAIAISLLCSLKPLVIPAIASAAGSGGKWIHTTYRNGVTTIAVAKTTGKG